MNAARQPRQDWGWLPELSLTSAIGLLLIALGDTAARTGEAGADGLFWGGLLLIFGPAAGRLIYARISERESFGLVLMLGFFLYLVKVMHSPVGFTFFDEFLHWRTLNDIIKSDFLFNVNPLLPTSAIYPGLEIVMTAVIKLSGLPYFPAAMGLLGLGRLVFLLSLYMIFKEISRSNRVAGLATLAYMTNPNFLFFDSDFSYESLALPLTGLVLFAMVRRYNIPGVGFETRGLTVIALMAGSAVVVTHHITSYALIALLILWTVIDKLKNRKQHKLQQPGPGGMALFVLVAALAWILNVASIVVTYLSPHLEGAVKELAGLIAREQGEGRQLFQSSGAGQVAPLWERLVSFGGVGLILLLMPFGLWHIWKNYRDNTLAITLAVGALLYPVSLAFRLTKAGWEASNRSSEFLFLAVGLVFALAISQIATFRFSRWLKWSGPVLLSACLSVMLLSGIIAGWNPSERLPEPYKVENGSRSIEPEGIAAAKWTNIHLGPNNWLGAYGTTMNLMGSYGDQNVSTTLSGGINVAWVLFAPQLETEQLAQIRRGYLKYFVIDRRISQAPYLANSFYPQSSITEALDKFDHIAGVSRIFDSGNLIIYDIGVLSGAS